MVLPTGSAALTRRRVLVGSGVLAAATVAGGLPGLVAPAAATERQRLGASAFAELVGRTFAFTARRSGRVWLRLDGVDGLGSKPAAESSFALRFHGPAAAHQGGEVGTLRGPGLAPTRLLVVPSGPARAAGQDWVATFVGAEQP